MKNFLGLVIIILVIIGIIFSLYKIDNYEAIYYAKIDNSKITKLSNSEDMKYEYNLECYNKNGHKKILKFKTTRELKENAYLLIKSRIFGVYNWEEVLFKDLPDKVKDKLN